METPTTAAATLTANQIPAQSASQPKAADSSLLIANSLESKLAELQAWATKSGFKSSEFTLVAMLVAGIFLLALSHCIDGDWGEVIAAVTALYFASIRANHKADIVGQLIDAFSNAQVTHQPLTVKGVETAMGEIAKTAAPVAIAAAESKITAAAASPAMLAPGNAIPFPPKD